nr:ribonuclease H-like domain-containing protein [Tanacetum cinerariifolium]
MFSESYDDGGDSANDNSDTAVLFCSTSSRKDTEDTQYAAETDVLEGIQGTILSDDEYESEGEDIEYFGKLFKSPEPSVGQNVKRSSRKSSMPSKYSDYVLNKNVKYGIDKANGEVERFKATLVAKGFNQREGIDYEETFSPAVNFFTIRCILSKAINNKWPLFQLDINNAFLYEELEEDVYMSIPEGYSDKNDKRVCKLVKSLYGLKQASRKWNEKLTFMLINNGIVQSLNDFSLFVKNDKDVMLIWLVYVDDIFAIGNNVNEINKFK